MFCLFQSSFHVINRQPSIHRHMCSMYYKWILSPMNN